MPSIKTESMCSTEGETIPLETFQKLSSDYENSRKPERDPLFIDSDSEEENDCPSQNPDDENSFFEDVYSSDSESSTQRSISPSPPPCPFWFAQEEPVHVSITIGHYFNFMKIQNACPLSDCRRLPCFVGRVERCPVRSSVGFKTLDRVAVFRRDIRQIGSALTLIEEKWVRTSWDIECGLPLNSKMKALDEKKTKKWKKRILDLPSSFMYCLPVWESKTEFKFFVETEEHDVSYADQPFNYTPYIPNALLALKCDEEDVQI